MKTTIKLPAQSKEISHLTVVEHKVQESFDPTTLGLFLHEKQKDGYIEGNDLKKELPDTALNACVLDYLLEHTELIPEEWKGKYVFFWGTIYRDSDGVLYVRCLFWHVGRWQWDYVCLGNGWGSVSPAAVSASKSSALTPSITPPSSSFDLRLTKLEETVDKLTKIINLERE